VRGRISTPSVREKIMHIWRNNERMSGVELVRTLACTREATGVRN
jgi:hypothetical protein